VQSLRNAFVDHWVGRENELASDDTVNAQLDAARRDDDFDTAYIYAGQAVGLVRERRTAATWWPSSTGAEKLLRRFAPGGV